MEPSKPTPPDGSFRPDAVQEFVYRVTHDLRSPISTILGYSDLLVTDHSTQFNDEGQRYLENIRIAAEQLSAMLEDLMIYARIGHAVDPRRACDLNQVLLHARVWAISRTAREDGVWQIQPQFPSIHGVESELKLLFSALLANAIQHNPKPKPTIDVKWREEGNEYIFSVSDDGPGVEPRFRDDVFRVFFRLRPKAGERSTGMGLSVAKRVVETHGGRIWYESTLDKGSTFFVALPKKN